MDTIIFAPDLVEYTFLGVSFSDKCFLLTFTLDKLLVFASLFNTQKKHVLNYFALEMATFVVARRRHRREQKECGWKEKILSTRIDLFGMPEEHIIWIPTSLR